MTYRLGIWCSSVPLRFNMFPTRSDFMLIFNMLFRDERSTGLQQVSYQAIIYVTRVVTQSEISMPKLAEKSFTDLYLKNLKPDRQRRDYFDAAQRGLGIRVAPSGLKTWFVMRRVNSRMTRKTLGRYPELSLSEARIKAGDLLSDMAKGQVQARKVVPVFAAVMEDWFDRDQKGNAALARSAAHCRLTCCRNLDPFQSMPLSRATSGQSSTALSPEAHQSTPIACSPICAGCSIGPSSATSLPCRPPRKSRRRPPNAAATALFRPPNWRPSGTRQPRWERRSTPAFRLLILTGQRRNELAGAHWTEFDLEKGEWTIPASRAKNGTKHIVHLAPAAVDILTRTPRPLGKPLGNDYVFTTTGRSPISGFSKIKAKLDRTIRRDELDDPRSAQDVCDDRHRRARHRSGGYGQNPQPSFWRRDRGCCRLPAPRILRATASGA